ncbi:MAG: carboxypeptidase regulatory-like domain-containing protein [Bacteroidota bacterium]|nr:carboxypeptidase regulatory-like domain-containing protein [Bacteroidota bacterium]
MRLQVSCAASLCALFLSACVKHPSEPKEPPSKPDSCCHGTLLVLPYDSASGAIRVGASVRVQKQHGDYTQTKVSDQAGALFTELCPGTYILRVAHEHCAVQELTLTLECNDVTTLRLPLHCEGRDEDTCCQGIISVRVADSIRMTPPPSATVRLWCQGVLLEQQLARNGLAAFDGLCAGAYVVEVLAEGYQSKEVRVHVECNTHVSVDVMLHPAHRECCEGVAEIVVRDSGSERPIAGALVRLWREGRILAEGSSIQNGVVRFVHLCKGDYGVSIHAEGYNPKEFEFDLGCNQTIERHVLLSRREPDKCCEGKVSVFVRDSETREPIEQAIVRLWKANVVLSTKSTDGRGRVGFERLCIGRYAISIYREDYRGYEQDFELGCNEELTLEVFPQKKR